MSNQNLLTKVVADFFRKNKGSKLLNQIKAQATILKEASDEELQIKIAKIKTRVQKENLDSILPDWFGLTQEISSRTLGLRHFDTQLIAGLLLHEGNVVEMKTGEGKTLASTLPVSLNALTKKGVHVVTVNEYLAERDQQLMGKLFKQLGLTTGLVLDSQTNEQKKKAYQSDITYVTNSQVVFDFLRDSSCYSQSDLVLRPFNYCVVDEIDSILIDEARTPLIISEEVGENNFQKLTQANKLTRLLTPGIHFNIDEKKRDIDLTVEGYQLTAQILGKSDLFDPTDPYILEILNALKANYIFRLNKDYIIFENKIAIVDELTGRVMPDRRWSQGIHEAVEIKENVPLGRMTKTKTGITYQNFFTLYPKLSGMSGTVVTTATEFEEIYKLNVVEVPTAKLMIREDLTDFVYQTNTTKWKSVLKQIKTCFNNQQPILVGTANVEKSELISDLLRAENIPHEVLNAKPENVARESEIVALAGKRGAVTIATNMAGRGTDIILGGNPIYKVKNDLKNLLLEAENLIELQKTNLETIETKNFSEEATIIYEDYKNNSSLKDLEIAIKNLPYSLETALPSLKNFYNFLYQKEQKIWQEEHKAVKSLGGLFVLGTERAETRRIDNQLRGRSGRQGDPGVSQFYVSLEDDLLKIFGGENIQNLMNVLLTDTDAPLEGGFLTRALSKAQEKVEAYYFEIRKNVFQYDEILNEQRKKFFKTRQAFLCNENYEKEFVHLTESFVDKFLGNSSKITKVKNSKILKINKLYEFEDWTGAYSNIGEQSNPIKTKFGLNLYNEIWISLDLRYAQADLYDYELLRTLKGKDVLKEIDFYWTEHIERMNYIRETISWRSYGQQNPLLEYNAEALDSYKKMYEQIEFSMIYSFLIDSYVK
jgi:preprotein translocase subunit SecA